jgi:peptidoglycan/xylan/chitin deacetylase (PgdA/CDA1 family)
MFIPKRILPLVYSFSDAVRLTSLIALRYGGCGSILMLHRLTANFDNVVQRSLYCSVDLLEHLIKELRRCDYDIISMSDIISRIQLRRSKRFIAITFDDGYRDNFDLALPIFRRHGIPFTIFVTSGMVRCTLSYWWRCLEELLLRKQSLDAAFFGRRISLATREAKLAAWQPLRNAYLLDQNGARQELTTMFMREGISEAQLLEEDALGEETVKALARTPGVEIGGHTETHPQLSKLTVDQAKVEIQSNKMYLESLIDREVRHFAYPFGDKGDCGPREFKIVRDLGFETAVTTRSANLFPEHAAALTALPRLGLSGGRLNPGLLHLKLCGGAQLTGRPWASPVVTD